jgi:hypothetical protein
MNRRRANSAAFQSGNIAMLIRPALAAALALALCACAAQPLAERPPTQDGGVWWQAIEQCAAQPASAWCRHAGQ